MQQQDEVRIPPKRNRLLGAFLVSIFYLPIAYVVLRVVLAAAEQDQSFVQTAFAILLVIAAIVSVPYFVLMAIWMLARLVFNLPALILTPEGIVNHSYIYHIVIPWREIDQFTRFVPVELPSVSRGLRRQGRLPDITVLEHDTQRLYSQQQPLTRALLRLFRAVHPVNINTDIIAETPEEVWVQLERYAHKVLGDTHIKFVTVQRMHSPQR